MYLSAFTVVKISVGVLIIQQAFGFLKLFSRLEYTIAAFDFIEVDAVFSNADQVHFT